MQIQTPDWVKNAIFIKYSPIASPEVNNPADGYCKTFFGNIGTKFAPFKATKAATYGVSKKN
jgi:hypothetical protein